MFREDNKVPRPQKSLARTLFDVVLAEGSVVRGLSRVGQFAKCVFV